MKIMFYALRPFDEQQYCEPYKARYGIDYTGTPDVPRPDNRPFSSVQAVPRDRRETAADRSGPDTSPSHSPPSGRGAKGEFCSFSSKFSSKSPILTIYKG